jgi:hypothetical protein
LLTLGRVLLAENKTGEAVAALERAARLNLLPEYQWALADALSAASRDDDAANVERRLTETGPANDPRSYSLFLATRGREPDVALRLAEEELFFDPYVGAQLALVNPQLLSRQFEVEPQERLLMEQKKLVQTLVDI